MHIIILVDDYLPSTKSAPLMIQQLAEYYVSQGHRTTVLTPDYKVSRHSVSDANGIRVVRFRSGRLKNVGVLRRAINEILLSFRLLLVYLCSPELFKDGKIIITYVPTIFWGPAAIFLRWRLKTVNYMILRDIFPQWAVDNHLLWRYSPITIFFRFFEWLNYCSVNRIGVQTPGNLKYFESSQFYQKCEVLYNWSSSLSMSSQGNEFREKYSLQDKVILFYGGNIGHAQDMANIMRMATNIKDIANAHIVLIGNGDEFELVARAIKDQHLENVLLLPSVPQEEYFKILQEIDIGIFSLHPDHRTQNIPGKLLGYMAAGKAVLGSVNADNDILTIINQNHAGLVSQNPDDRVFAANARKLIADTAFRILCGQNAKHLLCSYFNLEKNAEQILAAIDNHMKK